MTIIIKVDNPLWVWQCNLVADQHVLNVTDFTDIR